MEYFAGQYSLESPNQVHIKDSAFLNDLSDNIGLLRLLLPGGNHVFKMKNVTFSGERQADGEAVITVPQDCGLKKINENDGMATLCNVHYHFEDVDFTNKINGEWVGFSAVVGSPTAPVYTSQDGSLVDQRFLISNLYDGFEKVDGCKRSEDTRFEGKHPIEGAIACDNEDVEIARMIIWRSTSQGSTKASYFDHFSSNLPLDPLFQRG